VTSARVSATGGPSRAGLLLAVPVYLGSLIAMALSPAQPVTAATGMVAQTIMLAAGAVIVLRSDVHLLGWLLVTSGATRGYLLATAAVEVAARSDALAAANAILGLTFVPVLIAILLFPSGRPPTRFGRFLGVFAIGSQLVGRGLEVAAVVGFVDADPQTFVGFSDATFTLTVVGALLMHVLAYRHRDRVAQLQMRWFVLVLVVGVVLLAVEALVALPFWLERLLNVIGPGMFPVAILLAITRYRLYEIDRIVSRTVAYAVLLGSLAAVFVGGVALVTTVVPAQGRFAVAVTTVVVVALFNPWRRRVVEVVDRRFNRQRFEAQQVIERFGRSVQDETDFDAVRVRLEEVLGGTLAPATVALWQPSAAQEPHH
jgi:hypothetical protein